MRLNIAVAAMILLNCTACSVKVSPVPTATSIINPEDQSITEVYENIAFTVKLDQLVMRLIRSWTISLRSMLPSITVPEKQFPIPRTYLSSKMEMAANTAQ